MMTKKARGVRNWTILIAVMALLAFSGLAMAQESETEPDSEATEEGEGPPWLRDGVNTDWTPGSGGPPPWAGQDDEADGQGPPWTREGFEDWEPGTPGPPPWADGSDDDGDGPPFVGSDWTPGSGPPPWAGQDDEDDGQGPPWTREGFEDWEPGTPGPPPWAGQDGDDE